MKRVLSATVAASFALILALPAFAADPKAPVKPAAATSADIKADGPKRTAKVEQVDLNTATEEQLKSIAGVGDVYSKKIIAGRPYAKKDQLKSKKIIPADVYEKIKDKIIAKQPKQ